MTNFNDLTELQAGRLSVNGPFELAFTLYRQVYLSALWMMGDFLKVIPQSSGVQRCSPVLFRWKVETVRVLPQTQAHPRGPRGYDVYVLVYMSAVYPQRSGSSEHSLVREQHCEDLWFWPGQRHIQRPRLRQERQCMASLHTLYVLLLWRCITTQFISF